MKVTNKEGKIYGLLQIKEDQGTKELRNISVESGRSVFELYSQQKKRTIDGNDERARTELCLYKLCRARRRKAKPITEKAIYSVFNNISGIIMIIMIISF